MIKGRESLDSRVTTLIYSDVTIGTSISALDLPTHSAAWLRTAAESALSADHLARAFNWSWCHASTVRGSL